MVDLASEGHLAATARGLLYLDLDDRWVLNMQEELARFHKNIFQRSENDSVQKVRLPVAALLLPSIPAWFANHIDDILDVMILISNRSAHHPAASDEARG